MIWKDYLKLSEIAIYSKLTQASKVPPGRIRLKENTINKQNLTQHGVENCVVTNDNIDK